MLIENKSLNTSVTFLKVDFFKRIIRKYLKENVDNHNYDFSFKMLIIIDTKIDHESMLDDNKVNPTRKFSSNLNRIKSKLSNF